MEILLGLFGGLFLAFANGANDNFKGVATLLGSATAHYRKALLWATLTTALGSLLAIFFAKELLSTFSGKGLVPDEVISLQSFSVAVALAAGLTVWLATRFGFPISTTHALVGALVGAGLLASSSGLNGHQLLGSFVLPLLLGPTIALVGTVAVYPLLSLFKARPEADKEKCLCIGNEVVDLVPGASGASAAAAISVPSLGMGTKAECARRFQGRVLGIDAPALVNGLHYISSGVVSLARGLNDTPKIAALLLVGQVFHPNQAILGIGIGMVVGGILGARRVAETLSFRVTAMDPGEGLLANLMTGGLVILGSGLGFPLSTTHVSCGSLFGLGVASKRVRWKTLSGIVASWIVTLPVAALLGMSAFFLLERVMS